jgi:acetate kinase
MADRHLEAVHDAHSAVRALARWLPECFQGACLRGIGHRVVHGGTRYAVPVIVTPEVLEDLRKLESLAPLDQPNNLTGIDAALEYWPGVPQVACFDTAFHRGHRAVANVIPLPRDIRRLGIQRYGFHGLSYESVASMLPLVAPEIAGGRVIVARLGRSASLCALKNGRSVDTSLGFTPLDGLCISTQSGGLDPGVVLYLIQELEMSAREVEELLYCQSGLLGLSGVSGDMRDLLRSQEPGAKLAIDYFVYRATREIGALAALLRGIDGLVFTAAVGERSAEIRSRICEACSWLGISLDEEANAYGETRISTARSRVSAWVVPTNEELIIARHTGLLLGLVDAHTREADVLAS